MSFEIVSTRHNPLVDPSLHVWAWEIPVYLFLGGFVAGIMILSGWALWQGRRNHRTYATFSLASSGLFALGLGAISLGMLALFLDLSHKAYVWRLYLTLKPWSPMSWGAWILLLVYPVLVAGVLLDPPRSVLRALPGPRAALWRRLADGMRVRRAIGVRVHRDRRRPRHLHRDPALRAGRAAALVERAARPALPRVRSLDERRLRPLGLAGAGGKGADGLARQPVPHASSSASSRLFLIGLRSGAEAHAEAAGLFLGGPYTAVFWVGVVGLGIVLPLVIQSLAVTHRVAHTPIAPVLVLLGGLALRFVIVDAGQWSHWPRV